MLLVLSRYHSHHLHPFSCIDSSPAISAAGCCWLVLVTIAGDDAQMRYYCVRCWWWQHQVHNQSISWCLACWQPSSWPWAAGTTPSSSPPSPSTPSLVSSPTRGHGEMDGSVETRSRRMKWENLQAGSRVVLRTTSWICRDTRPSNTEVKLSQTRGKQQLVQN